jgi:nucleotidyltransferase substrate binding protein (TIGR01987 family)
MTGSIMEQDIRWQQRLVNFKKAYQRLKKYMEKDELNDLELEGLVQSFEYNFELAWNLIKDYFESQGESGILGSQDAFRLAFQRGLIDDGEIWMDMIKSRTLTSHTYQEEMIKKITNNIVQFYFPAFGKLLKSFESLNENSNKR